MYKFIVNGYQNSTLFHQREVWATDSDSAESDAHRLYPEFDTCDEVIALKARAAD